MTARARGAHCRGGRSAGAGRSDCGAAGSGDGACGARAAVIPIAAAGGKPARASAEEAAVAPSVAAPDVKAAIAPPEAPIAQPGDDSLANVHDDVDEQVLPIFLEEAAELFPQAGEQLRAWQRSPANHEAAQALQRTLHTFKGSARMAGAMRLGELTHGMESRLLAGDALANQRRNVRPSIPISIASLRARSPAEGEVSTPLPWLETTAAPEPALALAVPAPLTVVVPAPAVPRPAAAAPPAAAAAPPEVEAARGAMLRVRADLIDRLVNEAGEVAIARARGEGELRSLKGNLLELTNSVIRLRSQVREIEIQAESQIQSRAAHVKPGEADFDPLEFDRFTRFQELTRSLAEGVNDVSTVQQSLLRNIDDADAALLAQARLSRDVQQQLFSIRTVPFGSLSDRLYRIMRQTVKELDKRANLEIHGTQVELDRSVLEKLVGPLEHLLRNALDHGIESREDRLKRGKPETGEITLTVRQQGNEIAIEIADDGAGLDFDRIREKAQGLGLITGDVEPTEARLTECILRRDSPRRPGYSTLGPRRRHGRRALGHRGLGRPRRCHDDTRQRHDLLLYLPLTLAVATNRARRAGAGYGRFRRR